MSERFPAYLFFKQHGWLFSGLLGGRLLPLAWMSHLTPQKPSCYFSMTRAPFLSPPPQQHPGKGLPPLPWFVEAEPLGGRIKGVSMLGVSSLLFLLAYPHKKNEVGGSKMGRG